MKIVRHTVVTLTALFLLLGLPFLCSDYFKALRSGADAVTSASVALDAPSGEFVVLINRDLHPNADNLAAWETFFTGGDMGFIFEDLRCTVASGDPSGKELAESYRSRLPENQMTVTQEDGTLMLSKADHGRFDVIIMSAEAAERFSAYTVEQNANVLRLEVQP